jgi:hypothetical protein
MWRTKRLHSPEDMAAFLTRLTSLSIVVAEHAKCFYDPNEDNLPYTVIYFAAAEVG